MKQTISVATELRVGRPTIAPVLTLSGNVGRSGRGKTHFLSLAAVEISSKLLICPDVGTNPPTARTKWKKLIINVSKICLMDIKHIL